MRGQALVATMVILCAGAATGGAARGDDDAGPISACFDTHDVDLCIRLAAEAADRDQERAFARERGDCERRLVAAEGRGVFRCASDDPAAPVDARATVDLTHELAEAVKLRRRRAADDIYQRIVLLSQRLGAADCTAACNAQGQAMLRVSKAGPALVRMYRTCMSAFESAPAARALHARDRELYAAYMRGASERCRKTSQCDALEKYGAGSCSYSGRTTRATRPSP